MSQSREQGLARCLIDNASWPSACQHVAGIDEDTYATLRSAYGHLMGEMPHDRTLLAVGQLAYCVRAQLAAPRWSDKARGHGFRS